MNKPKRKARFRVGQVVFDGVKYFRISEIMPCFDNSDDQKLPNRFVYVDKWTEHREAGLRPLTKRERGD